MIRMVLTCLGLAVVVAQSSVADGSWTKHTMIVDDRESDVFVPACAQEKGAPMILSLHAWSMTKDMEETQIDKFVTENYVGPGRCFIVVYPQGKVHIFTVPIAGWSWNAGGCCPRASAEHIMDVTYLGNVIKATTDKFNAKSVFVVGVSNGGMMANRLACQDTRVKAFASVAGPLINGSAAHDLETFQCSRRVPLLHIHGDVDSVVPYDGCNATVGGYMCEQLMKLYGKDLVDAFPKVPEYIEAWRVRNGQPADAVTSITFKNGTTNCSSSGDSASNVTLCVVSNQGHAWPGHCTPIVKWAPGLQCNGDMDASYHVISFFQRYVDNEAILV